MRNVDFPALLPVYKRFPIAFERGEGSWLVDTGGRRYLDFGSGIAVTALGHGHPHLVTALQEQAAKLWHVSNLFEIPDLQRLGERLVENTALDTVFVCNSGAEANEAAIKMARRYWWARGMPERNRIVTFEGCFHGRTMAGISASMAPKMVEGFAPLLDGFDQVPFGDHEALRAAIGPHTAAVLIEPIQGEGGIRTVPQVCLRGLRELCDERDVLLIFDEVQCGIGRTGKLLAHEWSGIAPDIMPLAKGLGGGFPIGACMANARAASGMTAGTHGSTFAGNPLGCAVANAVLDVMLAPGFLDRVKEAGERLRGAVQSLRERYPDEIVEVRGQGLMLGLRTATASGDFAARLREQGLVTIPAGDNVTRLLPPLTVSDEEIDEAVATIDSTLRAAAT